MNNKFVTLLPAIVLALLIALPAQAGMRSPTVLRSQSRAVSRAISKNVERIIKPKLVIARGATGSVSAMDLSRDETLLVTAVGDNSLRLWSLEAGREFGGLSGCKARIGSVSISPDKKTVLAVTPADGALLFDLGSPGKPRVLAGPDKKIASGLVTPDGKAALAGAGGQISILDLKSGGKTAGFTVGGGPVAALAAGQGGGGTILAAACGGQVGLFDPNSGKEIIKLQSPGFDIASLGLDGKGLVLAGGGQNGQIAIWDLGSGKILHSFSGHSGPVTGVSLNKPGDLLASCGRDGKVRLWNAAKGTPLKDLGGHDKPVNFVRLDGDGAYALSGSEDGTTKLWNTLSGAHLVTLISTRRGWSVVDGKGRFDGLESSLAGIEWRDRDVSLPIENFSETHYQPGLLTRSMSQPQGLDKVQAVGDGVHLPPIVEIISPEQGPDEKDMVQVSVRAVEQGQGGVEDVRLFQNGKHVGDRGLVKKDRSDDDGSAALIKEYKVQLAPGDNSLSAVAVNSERIESSPTRINVKSNRAPGQEKYWLMTVGVNEYKNPRLNLNYAAVDADSIREFFASGKKIMFDKAEAVEINDAKATKKAIIAGIRNLRDVPPQDVVVIYLAGHGDSIGGEWYFLPHELGAFSPQSAKDAISASELKLELEAVSANRVFLIIDSCRSGAALDPIKNFKGMKALRLMARDVGVHILAATDRDQLAAELGELKHGVFTFVLLQGLDGQADLDPKDGVVSVREAMRFVEEQAPLVSRRYANRPQFPTGHSRGADFNLAKPANK